MNRSPIARIAGVVAALHGVALSLALGPRHAGYILTAILSAALIWSTRSWPSGPKRRAGMAMGSALALGVQQVAYHVWRAELGEPEWPLVQFLALQFLFALGMQRSAA